MRPQWSCYKQYHRSPGPPSWTTVRLRLLRGGPERGWDKGGTPQRQRPGLRPETSSPQTACADAQCGRKFSFWKQNIHPLVIFFLSLFPAVFFSYFKKFLFILNWKIITLQYCAGFCHTSAWISHRYMYVLSPWTSLPHPTPCYPSRLSQSPGLSSLSHMANSHWLSILHMIVYWINI